MTANYSAVTPQNCPRTTVSGGPIRVQHPLFWVQQGSALGATPFDLAATPSALGATELYGRCPGGLFDSPALFLDVRGLVADVRGLDQKVEPSDLAVRGSVRDDGTSVVAARGSVRDDGTSALGVRGFVLAVEGSDHGDARIDLVVGGLA